MRKSSKPSHTPSANKNNVELIDSLAREGASEKEPEAAFTAQV